MIGTPSNNVESVIGADKDGNGELSFDEEGLTVEWACGEWVVSGKGGEIIGNCETGTVSFVTYGPDTNGFVTAVLTIPIRRHKAKPGWLYDPTWNMVRVTKRGIDEPMERVTVATRLAQIFIALFVVQLFVYGSTKATGGDDDDDDTPDDSPASTNVLSAAGVSRHMTITQWICSALTFN